jgi:hypothetical protein
MACMRLSICRARSRSLVAPNARYTVASSPAPAAATLAACALLAMRRLHSICAAF